MNVILSQSGSVVVSLASAGSLQPSLLPAS